MATTLPIPPTGTAYIDPRTGLLTEAWRRYFLSLENLAPDIPPIDAQYWVSTANTKLTNERNIGALATGYLKITTAIGIATPSSVASIPGTDVTGAALTKTDDTNVTLTLGGTPGSALLRAASLTLGWTGQLGLARGGTNANLSATGGASQVLRQSSAGAAVTVSQLSTTDISNLVSSTYTPTLTNVANLSASTAYACQYIRVGSMVWIAGTVDVDPTLTATTTQLGISLPVASNFTQTYQAGGSAAAISVPSQSAGIFADTANDRLTMQFVSTDITNQAMYFTVGYQIL